MEQYTNELISESSPYLLQHAHNPVNWVAWSNDIFERAKKENKLVLISVGYSACHWCHVMEHECFEDTEVAALMNKFFINVKVDREERPDVDQVYMTAVQLMTQRGGWPLNCFTLPDGRPIYGGTYFPKEQWMNILKSLHYTFVNEREKVEEYAANLHEGIIRSELIAASSDVEQFDKQDLEELVRRWSRSFDSINGGETRAPKFPLPNNFEFLLDFGLKTQDPSILDHVHLSLDKMAMGGIYDQIGGGFARYSVDMLWKVPHFEKMLYDNGQLIELYSKAYKVYGEQLYKRIVFNTFDWLEREMKDASGAYYSALDADSEGVEGKYYVWSKEELDELFSDNFEWAKEVFEINQNGLWEGNYILLRKRSDIEVMSHFKWTSNELEDQFKSLNKRMLSYRYERVRPGTDDKILTSWNAMILSGLAHAFMVFRDDQFLECAREIAEWLIKHQLKSNGGLYRSFKNGKSSIDGFLEDYAHVINAFLSLYQADFDEKWVKYAVSLTEYTLERFYDENSGMFFFTSDDTELIARKMEINDNVIPSSNSVMARNLYDLGRLTGRGDYLKKSRQMLANVYDGMEMYGSGYSNWALLLNQFVFPAKEIVFAGNKAKEAVNEVRDQLEQWYLIAVCSDKSELSICKNRQTPDDLLIFVCENGSCNLPVNNVTDAVSLVIQ